MKTELVKLTKDCGRDVYDMLQSIPKEENGPALRAPLIW